MKTGLIVFLTTAVLAGGQDLERTFPLSNTATTQDLQELATVIRSTADIRQLAADAERKSITIHGNNDQIALMEWLLTSLDAPTGTVNLSKHKYRMPPGTDANVVAVFSLTQVGTVQDLAEVGTVVRSMVEIPRLFVYSARKAMVARGTPEQIDLVEWLVRELDQPVDTPKPTRREYTVPGPGFPDNVVRVFSLKPNTPVQRLQQIAKQVRVTTGVRRLFTYNAARTITLRGTPSQVEQAYQMIGDLDR